MLIDHPKDLYSAQITHKLSNISSLALGYRKTIVAQKLLHIMQYVLLPVVGSPNDLTFLELPTRTEICLSVVVGYTKDLNVVQTTSICSNICCA